MTVKISGEAEAYVEELLRAGGYQNAEQVLELLILMRRADDRFDAEYPPVAAAQLEQELLKGVRSAHRPSVPGEFRKLAERLIAEHAGE
jgi:hypothetical protein